MRILNLFHYWWFVIHNFFFFHFSLRRQNFDLGFFFAIIIYANNTQLVLARALNHPHFCHCTMCLTNTFSKKKCFLRALKTGQFSAVTRELKSTLVSALLHDSEFVQRSPSSAWEVREQKVGHPKSIGIGKLIIVACPIKAVVSALLHRSHLVQKRPSRELETLEQVLCQI